MRAAVSIAISAELMVAMIAHALLNILVKQRGSYLGIVLLIFMRALYDFHGFPLG